MLAMKAGINCHINYHWDVYIKGDSCLVIRASEMCQSVIFRRDIFHCVTIPVGAKFLSFSDHANLSRGSGEGDFQFFIGAILKGVVTKEDACHTGRTEIHSHQTRAVDFLASIDWELDPRFVTSS